MAVSAIFINVRRLVLRPLIGLIWLGGIGLIALSYLLSFTRTLWVGTAVSVLGVWLVTSWQSGQISRVLSRSIYAVFCPIPGHSLHFHDQRGVIPPPGFRRHGLEEAGFS